MEKRRDKIIMAAALLAVAPWIVGSTVAKQPDEVDGTIVSITGTGSAAQQPPLITLSAGVSSFATKASAAMQMNASAIDGVRSELRRYGIAANDIRTGSLNLSPETKHVEDGDDIEGFGVRHDLTVVFRDIGKSGIVVDALVAAGADQINGPRFSSEADERSISVGRLAAIRDANRRAFFYAKALGLKVRRVISMSDGGGYASGQPQMAARGPSDRTEISPGQDIVRVSVSAQYELGV